MSVSDGERLFQELKNQFISLLMSVQQKRRDLAAEKKRSSHGGMKKSNSSNGITPGTVRHTLSRRVIHERTVDHSLCGISIRVYSHP